MTVIVGVATKGTDDNAVVLGTDRAKFIGNDELVDSLIYLIRDDESFPHYIERLIEKKIAGQAKIKLDRKLFVSDDGKSALAHTGRDNDAHKRCLDLLLNPEKFLEDQQFLAQMLFPLEGDQYSKRDEIARYRDNFNLDVRLRVFKIPEMRRIFDMASVEELKLVFKDGPMTFWEKNYHPALSSYLLVRPSPWSRKNDKPKFFSVTYTGSLHGAIYAAKGCGSEYALQYIRKVLGTKNVFGSEGTPEGPIDLEKAVSLVRAGVAEANSKSVYCHGFDYVIVRKDGVEENFSDEQGEYELDLRTLVEEKLEELRDNVKILNRIKAELKK